MPAILAALATIASYLKIGFGIVSTAAITAMMISGFIAYVAAIKLWKMTLLSLILNIGSYYIKVAALGGLFIAIETIFGMLSAAIAIRFSRFLVIRAAEQIKASTGTL